MKINTPTFVTSISTALLLAAVAWLAPLAPARAASDTAKGGATDLIAVNPSGAPTDHALSQAGKACPSCRTVPVSLKLEQGKANHPVTVAAQKHECDKCDTTTQTVGHGKMRHTIASHVCQNQAAMACCTQLSHGATADHK